MKVREIRKRTNVKFEDIILTAFSASIHKYHLRVNICVFKLNNISPENIYKYT